MSAEDHRLLVELDAHAMRAAADAIERSMLAEARAGARIAAHEVPLSSSIDSFLARWSHGTGGGRRRHPRLVTDA